MKRKQNRKKLLMQRLSTDEEEPGIPMKTEMVAIDSENSKNPLICHLCLCKSEQSRPLFEESSKTVLESIRTVFQIEPIQDEAVPDQICTHCIRKIDDFISFREMVIENHQKLLLEVEKAKQVVIFEPLVKMEESEDEADGVEEKSEEKEEIVKKPPKQRKEKIKRKSTTPPPSTSTKLRAADKDDDIDALLRNFFKFECPRCFQTFPRFHALRSHVRSKHKMSKVSMKCYHKDCDFIFSQRCKLIEHLRRHGTIPALTDFKHHCKTCGRGFEYSSSLKFHLKQSRCKYSSNEMFQCHYCLAFYQQKGPLKRHFQINHGFDMFPRKAKHICKECNKDYVSDYALQRHIKIYHEHAEQVMCELCAKIFATKITLKWHINTVHLIPTKKVTCPVCGRQLKNHSTLCTHLRRSHQHQAMKCEICSKELRNREALISHMRRVHEAPKFNCVECGKAYHTKPKLAEHLTTHGISGDLYKCEWCEKTFNFSSSKSHHKKTYHPVEWLQSRNETYKWTQKIKGQMNQNPPETSTTRGFVNF